jgi:hypothetical protein
MRTASINDETRAHDRYLITFRKFRGACKYYLDKKCTAELSKLKQIIVTDECKANSCPILRTLNKQ